MITPTGYQGPGEGDTEFRRMYLPLDAAACRTAMKPTVEVVAPLEGDGGKSVRQTTYAVYY